MIGQTISHYKILSKIGEGGMGVVYRAHDTTLDRDVALKFLPRDVSSSEEERGRFIHEAKAASALDHPNICTIHEVGETDDGRLFIVMACYEGETLKQKVAHGHLSVEDTLDIVKHVARGLARAHEAGIVHRDIKPANIMITNRSEVKILDFGLAKLGGVTKMTKTGTTVGTVAYMSPEQTRGESVDHRTDIWSLGVMLYEMLAGVLPFKSEYEQGMVYAILNEEPKPLSEISSSIVKGLDEIVAKSLSKSPSDRYQHMSQMLADLTALQAGEEIKVKGIKTNKKQKKRSIIQIVSFVLIIVAIGLLIILKPFSSGPKKNLKSIAVLPFKNLSSSREDEYFSDGIAEDIRTQLSKIADLKVISQHGVQRYKNSDKSITEIGKDLNVATVLEGSVQRAGGQVRINAQLIDASDESHIWAERYDKEMTLIFAIQSDVAQQIANVLKAKLLPSEKERIEKHATENVTAYDYYSKGREYYNRFKKSDNESAILVFRKALALDPSYALAYAGLADAYAQRPVRFGYSPSMVDTAIALSKQAIAIDTNLAEGYKALGLAYQYSLRHEEAVEMYRHALELNPNYATPMNNMANSLNAFGRLSEAMIWLKRALRLDNLNPQITSSMADLAATLCLDTVARKYYIRTNELRPEYPLHSHLSDLYLVQGDYDKALEEIRLAFEQDSADGNAASNAASIYAIRRDYQKARKYCWDDSLMLAYLYKKSGNRQLSDAILRTQQMYYEKKYNSGIHFMYVSYQLAVIYAIKGQKETAYQWLQKAIDGGWRGYRYAQINPFFEDLCRDTRFRQMVADMKTKVEEQRQLVEQMERSEGAGN